MGVGIGSSSSLFPFVNLDFIYGGYTVAETPYTFSQLIDFTRTSSATYVDATGKIVSTPASRNLLTFTQEFNAAVWTNVVSGTGVAATTTADAGTAPDGTQTADRLQFNLGGGTTTADFSRRKQDYTTPASTYTFSVYLRSYDGSSTYNMHIVGPTGATTNIVVTGVWQRFTVTGVGVGTAITYAIGLRGGQTPANSNTADVLAWGAQLEAGSTATDYTRNNGGVFPPRFDYDPVTLAPRGLLVEEQRTNLLLRSEEFDNASWTKSRSTVTANATTSPDGMVDADKLVEDTTATATHRVFQQASKSASSVTRTFSVYLKAAERTFARVSISDNTEAVTARVDVDLSAGTINTAAVFGGTSISSPSASISLAGDGWYRISITATFDATITNPGAFVFLCSTFGVISYTGNGTSGIFAWGAQWEDGSFATSYIPTVVSQVTRTADVATITGANFSQWYNQSEGTFVAEFDTISTLLASSTLSVDDATNNNFIRVGRVNTTGRLRVFNGGVSQADVLPANAPGWAGVVKIAAAFKANDFAASVSGGAVATGTSGTIPAVTQLRLGTSGGGDPINGHIRSIQYYNTRLPNAQLQALTA